ncbi:MAG: polysaccharide pyruvyl transferase family protein [Brachybacterium sp.]
MPLTIPRSIAKEAVLRRKGLGAWLKSFDVILDTRAGDSFADIYTFSYLVRMSAVPLYAMALGVPLVMTPQTVGPFSSRRARILASLTLTRARMVMVRDDLSVDPARRLGRKEPIQSTDVAFALPRPTPGDRFDVLLNVSGLLWQKNPHVDHQAYRRAVQKIIDGLEARGRSITLFDHVVGKGPVDNDSFASAQVNADRDEKLPVIAPQTIEDVRDATASSRLVIGARMHACLNALSTGTPAIPMAYSRKFAPLFEPLGWTHTVDLREAGDHATEVLGKVDLDLTAGVDSVLDNADAALDRAVAALRRAA